MNLSVHSTFPEPNDIRSSSDPKSMIHKDNLQKTCGNCHPGASENFAKTKMHASTHMDAPFHVIGTGKGIDKVPLSSCFGTGWWLTCGI
jgi:kynurenine formamidase